MKHLRNFLVALGLISLFVAATSASAAPVQGKQYKVLTRPIAIENKGKIEVIEFFAYSCPHCFAFDPELRAWIKRQGKDVVLRRIPVMLREADANHLRIYLTLEAMGKLDAMHEKVFTAFHKEHKHLVQEKEIADLMAANGIDRAKFLAMYNSMSIAAKAKNVQQIFDGNSAPGVIDGVPTLVVQGKYVTSPAFVMNTQVHATDVLDYLVSEVRAKRK